MNTTWQKVWKRGLVALMAVLAGVPFLLTIQGNAWYVLPIHIIIALMTVFLGIKGIIWAAAEEIFVCLLLNAGLMLYPFVAH